MLLALRYSRYVPIGDIRKFPQQSPLNTITKDGETRNGYSPMRKLKKIVLFLPLLFLSGCADIQEYPKDWPKPDSNLQAGCSALIGSYYAYDREELSSLAGAVYPRQSEWADWVVITVPKKGTLEIVAYRRDTTVVAQRQFSEQDKTLSCEATEAVLSGYGGFVGREGVWGHSKFKRTLGKDRDGFLIVKVEESVIGGYGIFPLIGSQTKWVQLRPFVVEANSIPKIK
jgi:hypothetical protein